MSPIRQETIREERWTQANGRVKKQVVAQGTDETPGWFVLKRTIFNEDRKRIKQGPEIMVDVAVVEGGLVFTDRMTGRRIAGVWKKLRD